MGRTHTGLHYEADFTPEFLAGEASRVDCPSVPLREKVSEGSIQRFLYSATAADHRRMSHHSGRGRDGTRVYNVDLVRQLCADITAEKDSQKVQDLLSLLQAVIREDQEEVRIRMAFLAKQYATVISESKAAD